MNVKRILNYLAELSANNNRDWYQAHKDEYTACRADFEEGVRQVLSAISLFDSEISHLQVKDCVYRFNRDTRFSADKSPYKNHFGAYMCAKGKKALRGGYYLHVEQGKCLLAVGGYWLPTNILTSCRNEIMGNIDTWRGIVENKAFVDLFGKPNETKWGEGTRGFGLDSLKSAPSGFPRDYEFIQYLRMKDYCVWVKVPDNFFEGDAWIDEMTRIFKVGKPMMDFMNNVIDDYE